jgi:hypothetical protein
MELNPPEQTSLRKHVLDLIGSFLYKEKFPNSAALPEGILNLIDLTSSYREEGQNLYPEIFLTDKIDSVLETLPFCKKVEIARKKMSVKEFTQALKLCAPLSKDGWVVYMDVSDNHLTYGLVSSEMSELSPSFRKHSVGDLSQNGDQYAIAYLQYAGNKSVLLRGSETSALICLSLSDRGAAIGVELQTLCAAIVRDIDEEHRELVTAYVEKLIGNAIIVGHGNLINVVRHDDESVQTLKGMHADGVFLINPIDIVELVMQSEVQKTREASTVNRLYASLIQSMLNHDGAAIFTTTGKLLGYHVFAKSDKPVSDGGEVIGGARSRAYEVLKESGAFVCCFYKSQDGNEKIWSADDAKK